MPAGVNLRGVSVEYTEFSLAVNGGGADWCGSNGGRFGCADVLEPLAVRVRYSGPVKGSIADGDVRAPRRRRTPGVCKWLARRRSWLASCQAWTSTGSSSGVACRAAGHKVTEHVAVRSAWSRQRWFGSCPYGALFEAWRTRPATAPVNRTLLWIGIRRTSYWTSSPANNAADGVTTACNDHG